MNVLKKVCVALALCLALSGCGRRHEFSIKEELRPATFKELVAMDREQLERVDIARMKRPLGNWESLGMFIETTGYCHEANGRMDKAIEAYNLALRYLPNSENLKRLAARRVMPKEGFDQIQETLRFNEEQRRRAERAAQKDAER